MSKNTVSVLRERAVLRVVLREPPCSPSTNPLVRGLGATVLSGDITDITVTVVVTYKAGNLVAYKAGHLAAYKATHPSIWVRQLLPIRPHTPKF